MRAPLLKSRVLGVDPGSAATGWALVTAEGNRFRVEDSGVIRTQSGERAQRLAILFQGFSSIIERVEPECAAVESGFSGKNPKSGLSLAESRGVLLAALGLQNISVHSYSPAEVKSAIVGHGRAEKQQIVYMVIRLLCLTKKPPQDAADAMAIAMTHLQLRKWPKQ